MRAVILNSGVGSRMGKLTQNAPKCFVPLADGHTILERQICQLVELGVEDILITTGPFPGLIKHFVEERFPDLPVTFVQNDLYAQTNYIYSLYLAREYLDTDILLMHGDLVFDTDVLRRVKDSSRSCMTCDSTLPLPEKDFKAVLDGDHITAVGIQFFENACAAQPLYKILREDLKVWVDRICAFCEQGIVSVYAENAFNEVSDLCRIYALDVCGALCGEVDNLQDLETINSILTHSEEA